MARPTVQVGGGALLPGDVALSRGDAATSSGETDLLPGEAALLRGDAVPSPGQAVPLVRLDNSQPELMRAVQEVARSGAFTLGEHVESFEQDFAAYCEAPFALGVSSGTEALALALRALGVGVGDEVIVPANSFIATAEAVSAVGATPLLVDVDERSQLLTTEIVAAALRPRVRCVIPVHLYGATVDLDPILEVTERAGVHVVEDVCQAHGARYRGQRVGTLGALGCFSFYPTKNLGGWGDGGAVVTSDAQLAQRVRLLRSHGEQPRYRHRVVGSTARLDALQAAVLRCKLRSLDECNAERRRLGAALRAALEPAAPAITLQEPPCAHGEQVNPQGDRAHLYGDRVHPQGNRVKPQGDHVHHLFVVRSGRRDALRAHLHDHGVASAIHYPTPIHLTEAYAHLGLRPGSLPVCERLSGQICSLPLFPGMQEAELERVTAAILGFVDRELHGSGQELSRSKEPPRDSR